MSDGLKGTVQEFFKTLQRIRLIQRLQARTGCPNLEHTTKLFLYKQFPLMVATWLVPLVDVLLDGGGEPELLQDRVELAPDDNNSIKFYSSRSEFRRFSYFVF